MKNPRIVFMGTPQFAVASLGSLLINGFNVSGVVTAPDKPAGRGRKISASPVKEFAVSNYLPVMQPVDLSDPGFLSSLINLKPDIFIVVAFRMLPEPVWKIPPLGTFNLHASLLPQYRGAAPVNHAIINGETVTGVTTFLIDDKIDTGNILLREEVNIFPFENAGDLQGRLMKHGARLVIKTLSGIIEDKIEPQPQQNFMMPGEVLKKAPKIYPSDTVIDWNKDPEQIHNLIRGLAPEPCAGFILVKGNKTVSFKIYESHHEATGHSFEPGSIISDGKEEMKISCKGGFVNILQLKPEGRKRMSTPEFLRGFRISDYRIITDQQV